MAADEPSPQLLAWRITQLEVVEAAMRDELYQLRQRMPDRRDYYTRAEAENHFVTRMEVKEQRAVQRQWPMVISSIAVAVIGLVNMVVLLTGGAH